MRSFGYAAVPDRQYHLYWNGNPAVRLKQVADHTLDAGASRMPVICGDLTNSRNQHWQWCAALPVGMQSFTPDQITPLQPPKLTWPTLHPRFFLLRPTYQATGAVRDYIFVNKM
jgi:hypothetical protein